MFWKDDQKELLYESFTPMQENEKAMGLFVIYFKVEKFVSLSLLKVLWISTRLTPHE